MQTLRVHRGRKDKKKDRAREKEKEWVPLIESPSKREVNDEEKKS